MVSDTMKEMVKKNEEMAKKNDELLKIFVLMYKNTENFDFEKFQEAKDIDFTQLDVQKVISLWGKINNDGEKLDKLKMFIGNKRKNSSPNMIENNDKNKI